MKPRLILVEDHVLVRESIRAFLQEADFEVVGEASTGTEAVQLVCELQPDLVLLDFHLPEMNGIEVARRIRHFVPNTRLIALTAYNEKAYQRAFANTGAHGFILKTAAFSELLTEIQWVLAAAPKPIDTSIDSSADAGEHSLTKREHEVLSCAAKGWTNKQIGAHLHISDRTVQVHLQTIYQKLDVTSHTEAVSHAIARGIISPVDALNS